MSERRITDEGIDRRSLFLLGGMASASLLVGCGRDESSVGSEDESATLNYWTLLDPAGEDPRGRAEREIFDHFEETTGHLVVEHVMPWQEIDPSLLAAVQAGDPPEISRINYYNFQRHASAGSLHSLSELADRDFSGGELDDFVIALEGETGIEAFLVENIGNALFLRKDWLEEAGLEAPVTWDEFIETGKALQDVASGASGFLTFASTAEAGHVAYIFQPMIMGRGGQILNDDGSAAFNGEAGVGTYEFLRALVYDHEIMSVDAATTAYGEQIDAFIAGRVGMIIEGSHRYRRILDDLGPDSVQVVRIPGPTADRPSPCSITGWAMAIPSGSSNVDAAWELIKHRTDPAMQEIWAEVASGIPTRTSTLELPYFETEEAEILRWWLGYMDSDGELTTAPENDAEFNRIMAEALQDALLNPTRPIQEILDEAASQYNSVIA
ncbi:ABC transporter substrate-binding protein [Pseudactinotalea sp. Z1739]|uniref:ABC transporter substrate-binding protein n=1 Tax=Pseudactinotalea sp. Z1739 TaxID=3413028 RepID=UPI003C7D9D1F